MMIVPKHIRDTAKMLDLVNREFFYVPAKIFENMDFKIEASPFGKEKCCCGYINCVELECLINHIEQEK